MVPNSMPVLARFRKPVQFGTAHPDGGLSQLRQLMEGDYRTSLGTPSTLPERFTMPLAFSTLGCPGDSLAQVIATAQTAGVTGLEIRVADGEFAYPGMDGAARTAVVRQLADAGITVLSVASYVKICEPFDVAAQAPGKYDGGTLASGAAAAAGDGATGAAALMVGDDHGALGANDPVLADLLAAVELCADLSAGNNRASTAKAGSPHTAPQLRVFPGAGLEPCDDGAVPSEELAAADRLGAQRLNLVAQRARELGVTILLETHDSHPRASDIVRILAHVDVAAPVKVIWDVMHPWRYDETPARTAELLADSVAYAQYKDGVRNPGTNTVTLTLPGEGELPLLDMRDLVTEALAARGISDPWVSLEWERAWHPELPPVSEALGSLIRALA